MYILGTIYLGPSFAMISMLVTLRMRAVAVVIFLHSLISHGLGPLFAGLISDHLRPVVGQDSLRYALVITGFINLWAMTHYLMGARSIKKDSEELSAINKVIRANSSQ